MASSPELSFDPASMSNAVFAVLDDCLENIIADTVLKVHREEKQARMQSAAILAQQTKDAARAEASPGGAPTSITTAGATIDDEDRIFLHSNPLRSTTEILCPTCRLPRLLYPTMGKGARAPDPSKEYCAKQPFIDKDGCDIYGKSLTQEKLSKKKGTDKKKKKADADDDRSGSDSPTGSPANGTKDGKTTIPSGKCPYCPRYMAFTRLANHMDRCLQLHKRARGKKLTAGGTPQSTSRASTPKPGGAGEKEKEKGKKRKLGAGSDDEGESTPVKKKKVKKDNKGKEGTPVPVELKKERTGSGTPKPKGVEKRPG